MTETVASYTRPNLRVHNNTGVSLSCCIGVVMRQQALPDWLVQPIDTHDHMSNPVDLI